MGSHPGAWLKTRIPENPAPPPITLADGCGGGGWPPLLVALPDGVGGARFGGTTLTSGGGAGWLGEIAGAHVSKMWRSRSMRSAANRCTRRDSEVITKSFSLSMAAHKTHNSLFGSLNMPHSGQRLPARIAASLIKASSSELACDDGSWAPEEAPGCEAMAPEGCCPRTRCATVASGGRAINASCAHMLAAAARKLRSLGGCTPMPAFLVTDGQDHAHCSRAL